MNVATARLTRIAEINIAVALAVMGLKYVAYLLTGSVALYSDALESIVNIITALIALYAISVAGRPADRRHQYGHHKAEYFAAVIEGVLIVVAALLIVHAAIDAIRAPRPIVRPGAGMAINAVATALNFAWALYLLRWGRRNSSPALAADGWHLMTDVVTSAGVLAGLLAAYATGWPYADPALAIMVALNILWAGWRIVRGSVSSLLDEAIPAPLAAELRELIAASAAGAIEVHDLKTRMAGRATFIELHLVVPGAMSVAAAHQICDRIELAVKARIAEADVLIHVEPEGEAKHAGVLVL